MPEKCKSCGKVFGVGTRQSLFDRELCTLCNMKARSSGRFSSMPQRQPRSPQLPSTSYVNTTLPGLLRYRPVVNQVDISRGRITRMRPSKDLREQNLPVETFDFDHSRSRSTSTETFVIRQSRKVVATIDFQKAKTASGGGGIKLLGILDVQATFTDEIRRNRATSHEAELTVEQTTSINVPANTRVKVEIHWKLVWERGVCEVTAGAQVIDIPYSVTRRLRFDKKVIDV